MAKQQQQNKLAKTNRGEYMVEQNFAIDDSLLPSANELEKLKDIDPTIIQWLKDRAEIEQNARIGFNNTQLKLTEYNLHKTHSFNYTALIFSFILFLSILGLSAYFIINGLSVTGTIFGGAAIISAVIFYVRATIKSRK